MPYVRTRLGRLFYEEHGETRRAGDPAIVLMHGLLFDGDMWRGQVSPLTALGRVVVLDGPGHGKSEPPPRFTLEEHADALLDVFGDLGIARALLVGHSWGGMVALRFALQHGAKVAGLALVDTTAEREPLLERLRYRAFVSLHRRVGMPYALFLKEVAPLMFGADVEPALVRASYRAAMGFDREGVARSSLAVMIRRVGILDRLGAIRAPTLVLCGRDDRATTPDKSENLARVIPGARLALVEAGHMSPLEAPEAVNEQLVPFAQRVIDA